MRPAAFGRLGAIIVLSLAIGGCGKPAGEASAMEAKPAGDPNQISTATARPVASSAGYDATDQPDSPSAIADRLTAPGAVQIEAGGFTMTHGVMCYGPGFRDRWAQRCRVRLADMRHGPAEVIVEIYEQDQDFAAAKATLGGQMDRQAHASGPIDEAAFDIPGGSTPVPGWCHQTIGNVKSHALCMAMARPRVIVYAIVSPTAPGWPGENDMALAREIAAGALAAISRDL